ncbi:MAG: ribonuclease R family protein [Phycisphaerales bacterium JB039]
MPLRYKSRLLDHLAHPNYQPASIEALAEQFRVEDPADFRAAVEELGGQGVIELTPGGLVSLPSIASLAEPIEGEIIRNAKGFGFFDPEVRVREGSIFVPPGAMMDAATGDTVRISIRRDRKREASGRHGFGPQYVGAVVEVVRRKRTSFAGTVEKRGAQWVALPDGKDQRDPIVLRDAEAKNVAPGDKVVVEMLEFPEGDLLGEGVITRVLGEAGRPDVETQAVIAAHGLPPDEFPDACVRQAREATDAFDKDIHRFTKGGGLEDRLDLTDTFITTIDPPDAKDYDDAISLKREGDGWELGVHIADVAHFIGRGTALDEEAQQRGNSVYLPRHVIPMLPELLSNGICSLQEGVERFAKTVFIRFDREGKPIKTGVAQSVIRSAKRMTYLEAQALIDGNQEEARKHAKTETAYTDQLISTVKEMDRLARIIRERRRRQGMISLDLPEVELIYDDHGHVIDAEPEDDAFTHTIIEMFMVEANEAIARLFENMDVPIMRRIHPEPTPAKYEDMGQAAKVAGYTIPKNPTREELQGLLDATRGKPAARAVHMAVLRTLTKAVYSPALIGHFALASDAYSHFTSPIRRYADLLTHRALEVYLSLTDNGQKPPRSEDERARMGQKLREHDEILGEHDLMTIGHHITTTEENATEAERELRQFLVLQLLEKQIGEVFGGVITGVTPRGVFVQLDKYLADGFIKSSDLPGDVTRSDRPPFWKVDQKTGALVDQNSGRSWNFGDTVRVQIAQVDLARRQLELLIADAESRAAGKSKAPKLTLGADSGGLGHAQGAGFKPMTGSQRRSRKSKSRDRGKGDHRRDRK